MIFIKVHRGKEKTIHRKYQQEIGVTAACAKRMMEATNGIGHKSIKGVTKYWFFFNRWFYSNNAGEYATEVGANLIGMVKTNTK